MKTDTIPSPIKFKGTIARVAIQCTCPDSGETGSFLYVGETWRNKGSRCTPVYSDLAEMFPAIAAKPSAPGFGCVTYHF